MKLPRRELLKFSSMLTLLTPASQLVFADQQQTQVTYAAVKGNMAEPLLNKGDYVLVDDSSNCFQGDGVYLYPNWGQPTAYLVKQSKQNTLDFYYPGQSQKLWQMDAQKGDRIFSGMLADVVDKNNSEKLYKLFARHSELAVPKLPLT